MRIEAIFDNGGKTLDRYTVVIDQPVGHYTYEMLGLAEGGDGVSMWSNGFYYPKGQGNNRHLGKRVTFEDLSEATQRHIAERVYTNAI